MSEQDAGAGLNRIARGMYSCGDYLARPDPHSYGLIAQRPATEGSEVDSRVGPLRPNRTRSARVGTAVGLRFCITFLRYWIVGQFQRQPKAASFANQCGGKTIELH